jgi:putative membrane protein
MPAPIASPEILAFAAGFPLALLHAAATLLILAAGAALYALLTPHREIALIREGNTAAAISFGGVLTGLALPLAAAMTASASLLEIIMWGAPTVVVQLLVFRLVDLLLKGLPERIQHGEMAAAALLAGAKLASAVVLAAAVAG